MKCSCFIELMGKSEQQILTEAIAYLTKHTQHETKTLKPMQCQHTGIINAKILLSKVNETHTTELVNENSTVN